MSAPVTESDTFPSAINAPEVNDTNYPAVVTQLTTDLANRTKHLKNTLTTGGSTELFTANGQDPVLADLTLPAAGRADMIRNLGIALHKQIRWVRERLLGTGASATTILWQPALIGGTSTYWGSDSVASAVTVPYINQKTADVNYASLTMPHVMPGLVFGTLTATVQSATSHGGSLPASMPRLALGGVDSTGTAIEIAGALDTSGSAAAFEAMHTISCPINSLVQTGLSYFVAVRGEGSTNAQNNSFKVHRLSLTVWYV
jgi:hypothetical protein